MTVSLDGSSEEVFDRLAEERCLFLKGEINPQIATTLVAQLLWLDKVDTNKLITLYINSPGGTIQDGLLAIYDAIQGISSPVSTICIGEACSAAAVLLASGHCKQRLAYPNVSIMIHSVQASDVSGSQLEIEQESKQIKKLNKKIMEILAKHTKQSLTKVLRDCKVERWLTAEEAIKYGIIDSILLPSKESAALKTFNRTSS